MYVCVCARYLGAGQRQVRRALLLALNCCDVFIHTHTHTHTVCLICCELSSLISSKTREKGTMKKPFCCQDLLLLLP